MPGDILITKDIVDQFFEYRDGHLYWKNKIHNACDMENPAGAIKAGEGYRLISLNGKIYREHLALWRLARLPCHSGSAAVSGDSID